MKIGYNTNGFSNHHLTDAICILSEIGFQSIALTVDIHSLPPNESNAQTENVKQLLEEKNLGVVVETGSRFLLDPYRKHFPNLLSETQNQRLTRIDFLKYCSDLTKKLGGKVVSLWSGSTAEGTSEKENWNRLTTGLQNVLDHAADQDIVVGFEPEPGMFIDRMDRYEELLDRCGRHPALRLTLDVGHLHCPQ